MNGIDLVLDEDKIVNGYIKKNDWRINENANISPSYSGLLWHGIGTIMAHYALKQVYPKEIAKAHINGDFHLHNLSMSLCGYCAGWSLRQLLLEGFNGVKGKVDSKPPKHLRTALGQMVNFTGVLQNEWAGAQAFSSFDTYLAPFVRYDKLNYEQVKQCMQEYVYGMNITSRWGSQSPFSNITLDWTVPEDIKNDVAIVGGKAQANIYADYQPEMDIINKAFIEIMTGGDANGRVFTWPIPTYNITKDLDWGNSNLDLLFGMTSKYGLPYFQNFINSNLKPSDVRSMCCHLRLDLKELRHKTGGLFGFGESTGSVGVVTINLPRLGYVSKNEDEFFERLSVMMTMAKDSLEIKRKFISMMMDKGFLPFSKRYLGSFNHHFSTIGLIGMAEAISNAKFLNTSLIAPEGKEFALKVLDFMREKIIEFQKETGQIYNLEATPAEGTTYRLAKTDKSRYKNIKSANMVGGEPYYTNSSQIPVWVEMDLFSALKHQEELQCKYTGGTVFHTFLGESNAPAEGIKNLVKKIATGFKLPYFTISPTFSICPSCGYLPGEQPICPNCKRVTEVYSRVVGYYRPVKYWNRGKKEEFKQRKNFLYD